MWFRGLVGLAAVAVIAFVAYFFWGEQQRKAEADRVAAYQDRRNHCLNLLDEYTAKGGTGVVKRDDLNPCVNGLLLTTADIDAAKRKHNKR